MTRFQNGAAVNTHPQALSRVPQSDSRGRVTASRSGASYRSASLQASSRARRDLHRLEPDCCGQGFRTILSDQVKRDHGTQPRRLPRETDDLG